MALRNLRKRGSKPLAVKLIARMLLKLCAEPWGVITLKQEKQWLLMIQLPEQEQGQRKTSDKLPQPT